MESELPLVPRAVGLNEEVAQVLARASLAKESAIKNQGPASSKSAHLAEPISEASKDEFTPPKVAWNLGSMTLSAPSCGDRPPDDGHPRASTKAAKLSWPIQAKLEVGAVEDPLEREADRVAEQVMRMPEPLATAGFASEAVSSRLTSSGRAVQRKCRCGGTCAKCQAEHQGDGHSHVQRESEAAQISSLGASPASPEMTAPPIVDEVLRDPGQPLDVATRVSLEPHFGEELLRVRLHSDTLAERSAHELNARAYTVGNHIVFGPGQYVPGTHDGRRLLAHELTHVVQQSNNKLGLQRQPAKNSEEDRAAAVAEAEAACTTKQLDKQADEEERLKLDSKKKNDKHYALTHGARDKARIEKKGLSATLAQDIGVKMRFFEGGAKAAYIRSVEAAVSNYPDEAQDILEPCAPTGEEERDGPPQAQMRCDVDKKQFLLQYEDEPEKTRCIDPSDPEFENLFDTNIASAAAYAVPKTTWENVDYDSFEMLAVKYKNGTGEYFLLDELGNFHYGETVLGIREYTYFKRKNTGLIYPITNGRVYFNEAVTPRIIAYKNGLYRQVKQLQDLYQLLQAAGAFAQIIALNAINEDFKNSIQGLNKSRLSGFKSVKTRGGGGAGAGGAGVDTSSGVPDPVEDEPTARMGENERMGQEVGDITIAGDRRLNGDTYEIEIGGLFGKSGRSGAKDTRKTTDISGIKQVVSTLIDEGKASGAKRLKVTGYAIADPNIMRNGKVKIEGLVRSLGGSVRPTGPNSMEIVIPLK
jgi:hypothetical protein